MEPKQEKPGSELFRGVLLVHVILGLHLGLIALVGLLVVFFGGIVRYWAWILAGGLLLAGLGGFWVYRRTKARGRSLFRDERGESVVPGGTVEVSFLGGLASVKLSKPAGSLPHAGGPQAPLLLEPPEAIRIRDLASLAEMYEKDLITREEFERAKGSILNPAPRSVYEPGPPGH
jgi:hypothetical protein